MYTVIASPTHVLPHKVTAVTLKDDVHEAYEFRRRLTRPLGKWELLFPGTKEVLDSLSGMLHAAQGDTLIKFDGAGMLEVTDPIIIGVGDGTTTDFMLPHRNVYVSSTVLYLNGSATNAWQPLGGDGVTMYQIRMTAAPGTWSQIKAKYKRYANTVWNTEEDLSLDRAFREQTTTRLSIHQLRLVLTECPN